MKPDPNESIHVTMHIVSRRTEEELRSDKGIRELANETFKTLMQPSEGHGRIAARLSLPEELSVKWDVEIAATKKGIDAYEGHVPIMVSVSGMPGLMEQLNPEAVEEITNTVFKEIRAIEPSKPFARALGYSTDDPVKFHMYLPHQVRVRGPANPDEPVGDGDGDGDGGQGPVVWVQGGWSKGCDSWPW